MSARLLVVLAALASSAALAQGVVQNQGPAGPQGPAGAAGAPGGPNNPLNGDFTVNGDAGVGGRLQVAGLDDTGTANISGQVDAGHLITTGLVVDGGSTFLASGLWTAGWTASGSSAFDLSGSTGAFKTSTGAVTIGPGAVSLSGAVSESGNNNFDLSASSGAFKTPTGANTFGGSSNSFTNRITANSDILFVTTGVSCPGQISANNAGIVLQPTANGCTATFQPSITSGSGSAAFTVNNINTLSGGSDDLFRLKNNNTTVFSVAQTGVATSNGSQVTVDVTAPFTTSATSIPAVLGCADTAETVTNAAVDKACAVAPHSNPASAGGWSANCFASAAGTIQLHLCCVTATCTANSVTWTLQQHQ